MEKSLINTYKTNKNIDRNIDRNIGIDILRFIAAFGVICIHQPFEGEFGQYFKALSRFSVPIFFMITGYFYNQTVKNGKENKQIVKIIKLCIISNLLYFLYDIIIIIYKNGNIASYFQNTFNFKSISKLILFNESPFGYHLWYLNALLYVLIIAKIVNKHDKYKWMYLITPVLLLLNLIIGKYSLITIKRDISFIYVRNFLLLGIPYFFIGSYINNKFSNGKIFIKKKYLVVFVLIFCMSTIIERTILVNNSVNGAIDYYLSTIFLSISIFIIW